jgi:hypothetical protein
LALKTDLVGTVASAIFAIVVVGFTSDGLLSGSICGNHQENKNQSEEAEIQGEFHRVAPVRVGADKATGAGCLKAGAAIAESLAQRTRD